MPLLAERRYQRQLVCDLRVAYVALVEHRLDADSVVQAWVGVPPAAADLLLDEEQADHLIRHRMVLVPLLHRRVRRCKVGRIGDAHDAEAAHPSRRFEDHRKAELGAGREIVGRTDEAQLRRREACRREAGTLDFLPVHRDQCVGRVCWHAQEVRQHPGVEADVFAVRDDAAHLVIDCEREARFDHVIRPGDGVDRAEATKRMDAPVVAARLPQRDGAKDADVGQRHGQLCRLRPAEGVDEEQV